MVSGEDEETIDVSAADDETDEVGPTDPTDDLDKKKKKKPESPRRVRLPTKSEIVRAVESVETQPLEVDQAVMTEAQKPKIIRSIDDAKTERTPVRELPTERNEPVDD